MLMEELEAQCMALSNVVDTEIVEGDPTDLPTFDKGTLYVWAVPGTPELRASHGPDSTTHTLHLLRGRYGERDALGGTLAELAEKLGIALPAAIRAVAAGKPQ